MKKHNLHNHTNYSDGTSSPSKAFEIARDRGIEIFGISDHAFTEKLPNNMQVGNIGLYLKHLRGLEESLEKRNFKLKAGLEIDVSKNTGIDPKEIPFGFLNELDYVLFEYVNTKAGQSKNSDYRDILEIVKIRNKLKIPVGLAHNELNGDSNERKAEVAKILSENDIFVEIIQDYKIISVMNNKRVPDIRYGSSYLRLLNELRDNEVKFVAGTDSHAFEDIISPEKSIEFIRKNNLKFHEMVL